MKNWINTTIITNYIKENNLTKTKFCKLCKISTCSLYKVLNGINCSLRIVYKIAVVTGAELKEFFKKQ